MSTTVNIGWLKDNNGNKFAPKTLSSQVINEDGVSVGQAINQIVNGVIPIVTASSADGVSYTATVNGLTSITVGAKISIIPNKTSTHRIVFLNVNGLGDKYIRMPLGYNTAATSNGPVEAWIVEGAPITLEYDGEYWKTISTPRPAAQYLYGAVPIENGGTGATDAVTALINLGAQKKITGTSGQFVVIGANGNVTTKTITIAEEVTF